MLQTFKERYRETAFTTLISLCLILFSMHAIFVKGDELTRLAQDREAELTRLRDYDVMLSAEIGALRSEIKKLKTDSEETSLVARTLLGMVDSDEGIYQLKRDLLRD